MGYNRCLVGYNRVGDGEGAVTLDTEEALFVDVMFDPVVTFIVN